MIRPFDRRNKVMKATKFEIIKFALDKGAFRIETREDFYAIKKESYLIKRAYAMDINGNESAVLWTNDENEWFYCINKGLIVSID